MTTYISAKTFSFLRDLNQNNNRDWFETNKTRYERDVRGPLLQFVSDFGLRLAEISPYFVADARKSGGSLFRINRDVRFSLDKSPYKTHAGIQFRHESGKDVHAPGFYLHLEPDGCFAGVGIWHPDNRTLSKIRDAIVAQPEQWQAARDACAPAYQQMGDSLVRAPKGYDTDHPLIEDLRRKDFIAGVSLTESQTCAPDFIEEFAGLCRLASPFNKFLTEAVGLPY